MQPEAILIAGPTASGKSSWAIELANTHNGVILNTDSMQIYPILHILSARPSEEDLLLAPHLLYGYAPLNQAYSVARWLEDAKKAADAVWLQGKTPIFVGGTGLYFRALEKGLAGTPNIPPTIRAGIRSDLIALGSEVLHQRLAKLDPTSALRLLPTDGHRIARALEVFETTGKSLEEFQREEMSPAFLAGKALKKLVLLPPRAEIHTRINHRTELMIKQGAIDEVIALLSLDLPESSTVLKAIGVRQIEELVLGKISINQCIDSIKSATRQYSKRQSTWFRGQFDGDWLFVDPSEPLEFSTHTSGYSSI